MKTIITIFATLLLFSCKKPLEPKNIAVIIYKPTGKNSNITIQSNESVFSKPQYGINNTVRYLNQMKSNFTISCNSYDTNIYYDSLYVYLDKETLFKGYVIDFKKEFSIK